MRTYMRTAAVLLTVAVLLGGLCGCTGDAWRSSEVTGAPEEEGFEGLFGGGTSTVASGSAYRAGMWDDTLLPSDFPQPVPVAAELFTLYDGESRMLGAPCESWVLAVEVTAAQWAALNESFAIAGWTGGGTDVQRTRSTDPDGAWLSPLYYAYVFSADYTPGTATYTVQIAVFRRSQIAIPAELTACFPEFGDGYSHTGAVRVDDDENGRVRWTFGGVGRFVSVTDEAVTAYRQTLTDVGFAVSAPNEEETRWTAVQQQESSTLSVEALYDPDCKTLELVYTVCANANPTQSE